MKHEFESEACVKCGVHEVHANIKCKPPDGWKINPEWVSSNAPLIVFSEDAMKKLEKPKEWEMDRNTGKFKPKDCPQKEWDYAVKRAQRATDYAAMFTLHVGLSDKKLQDPLWQWENEVKGRYNQRVGGA